MTIIKTELRYLDWQLGSGLQSSGFLQQFSVKKSWGPKMPDDDDDA